MTEVLKDFTDCTVFNKVEAGLALFVADDVEYDVPVMEVTTKLLRSLTVLNEADISYVDLTVEVTAPLTVEKTELDTVAVLETDRISVDPVIAVTVVLDVAVPVFEIRTVLL